MPAMENTYWTAAKFSDVLGGHGSSTGLLV